MPEPIPPASSGAPSGTDTRLRVLKRRLIREATLTVSMLESALAALWTLDVEGAKRVRMIDDSVDQEEVAIEQACHEILALRSPFAKDFRAVTFILRVNADLERVGDHATSIAKIATRIAEFTPMGIPPKWPTALRELGERVPACCHELIRVVLDEDLEGAKRVVAGDKTIDLLERRVFEETLEMVRIAGRTDADLAVGLLVYRAGRELERVADLMAGIAENLMYLITGEIMRHQKKKIRASVEGRPSE